MNHPSAPPPRPSPSAHATDPIQHNGDKSSGGARHAPNAPLGERIRARVAETVIGQDAVVESILIALLTGGHLLLQGVPGLAKTLLVHSVASAIDLRFGRVQFTIDLLPSDILGAEVLDEGGGGGGGRSFRIHKGPVFTNLLLADEINRATPKVQSALLEAMQERRVTIGNQAHPLPTPFLVIATQNPIEQSGTFELPEAQLDRFMMCQRLEYPLRAEESQVVRRSLSLGLKHAPTTSTSQSPATAGPGASTSTPPSGGGAVPMSAFDAISTTAVVRLNELTEAMAAVQRVHVSDVFVEHCVTLVERTRRDPDLELGCSPRAGIALTHAARARAYLRGRDYVTPEDLFVLSEAVMLHRMRLNYAAVAAGRSARDVLHRLLESTW